jgi:hypothetical protein
MIAALDASGAEMDDATDPLAACQAELDSVIEENQHLRASANAFADLAERLKATLDYERRRNARDPMADDRTRAEEEDDPLRGT